MKKILIGSLALGSLAAISIANFSQKPTQLCTLSSPHFPEKITADCSNIYSRQEDSTQGIYEGKYHAYEWSCFRVKDEETERKARAIIEKNYFPTRGYDVNKYLFPERVFCSVEGIHLR